MQCDDRHKKLSYLVLDNEDSLDHKGLEEQIRREMIPELAYKKDKEKVV